MSQPAEDATRALRAYRSMQRVWRRPDGLYRRSGWLGRLGLAEHLWPAARAFAATLDLAGIAPGLIPDFDSEAAIAADLRALERYWDDRDPAPAYASDVPGTPWGGDRYYDDNAWMGLALVQLDRLRSEVAPPGRAGLLFAFARTGWDRRRDAPSPGGVFWVEQGRGAGRRNHDRNTVSNAPNAALGLHVDAIEGGRSRREPAARMHDWVRGALAAPDGLYFDRIRGDGSVDCTRWSYNQGSMVGAGVLRHQADDAAGYLARAQDTARRALAEYRGRYAEHPPAFNAIFFRNLLLLHAASSDAGLRRDITDTLRSYADELWARRRAHEDLLPGVDGSVSVLDQSALVSVLALLAWEPEDYRRLA